MVYGASVPLVLTPAVDDRGDVHSLVGGCYVHNLMDGQMADLPLKAQDFILE